MHTRHMAEKKNKKGLSGEAKATIGFGLTAAAATAAGAYFLYGSKNAAKNRKKVKSWALKAKAEVLEGLEKAEQLTDEEYAKLVEAATGVYGTVKNATKGEIADFKKEMLAHWKDLQKSSVLKKVVAGAVVKKIAKKSTTPKKKATQRKSRAKKTTDEVAA